MANNQDHVWHILRDVLELLAGSGIPTPERGYALDGGWSLALSDLRRLVNDRNALRVQIKTVIAERDALRAELARLQAKLSAAEDAEDVKNGAINNLTAELAAAKEEIAKMRSPLTNLAHAGEVLEAMAKKGWSARIATNALSSDQNGCEFFRAGLGLGRSLFIGGYAEYGPNKRVAAVAKTIPTAICNAALLTEGVKEEEL